MNESNQHSETRDPATGAEPVDPAMIGRLLDRLVDGELPDAQRAALLRSLDAEPARWRDCAMAFLEAQAWSQAMADLGRVRQPVAAASPPPVVRRIGPLRLIRFAAAAMVLFAVGLITGMAMNTRDAAPSSGSMVNHPGPAAENPAAPGVADTGIPGAPEVESREPAPTKVMRVPLFAAGNSDPREMVAQTPLDDAYVASMERKGYRIERERKIVSVALKDGRTISVPIDAVKWQYVGPAVH